MRDDMHENRWSPFDPRWYQQAFDKFISTADQLFNQNEIISQGFVLPDSDGSKSSVFRRDAVLNNSFNEKALRETLKDIYINSSHKLVASNHDNVHFFQWNGHMSDVTFVPNTNLCEIVLPTDSFIFDKSRDKYKLSQFYRKWIDITDILSNWDVFKWCCLLFINKRIYSEYQLRIDDQQTTIRFRYEDFWNAKNYPIYVYKFDTKFQCRIKISQELVKNQWNWKVPLNYISDQRILNSDHVMVAFNKIADRSIRTDDITTIDVMGDNLEFLPIKDGCIDISNISEFNKRLIKSEARQWMWMSIIVPKFFHEYPILLPTDIIYRPYHANMVQVMTSAYADNDPVNVDVSLTDAGRNLYINLDENANKWNDGWKYVIRPVVLADAFDEQDGDLYEKIDHDLTNLRSLTAKGADVIEQLRTFMSDYTTDEKFYNLCDQLEASLEEIRDAHNKFLTDRKIDLNEEYDAVYAQFIDLMPVIRGEKYNSKWFHKEYGKHEDFWSLISPLIYIPRDLADKYYISTIISNIGTDTVWEDKESYIGQHRFRRPIDSTDFWTFEYDMDKNVWRPYPMNVERHFPDVYTFSDPAEETPSPNRVFKAFFFYSDTANVREHSDGIIRASASWDQDMEAYELDRGAVYRDIFMEKFYWMGVKAIYKGLTTTRHRWEILEYVQDNASYSRFNELFLNTMDPYFKMGLASYLKSDSYEFPFDDAISKLNERINQSFLGYKRVTNFEMYLNKTWVPSYFDFVTNIMDDWDWTNRLIRRPRDSFDTKRLLPVMIDTQNRVRETVAKLNTEIDWVLEQIKIRGYNIDKSYMVDLRKLTAGLMSNLEEMLEFTSGLDLEIYSIDDVNKILAMIEKHQQSMDAIRSKLDYLRDHNPDLEKCQEKYDIVKKTRDLIDGDLYLSIHTIGSMIMAFDIESFIKNINNPAYYNDPNHDDDECLIGMINRFRTPWPDYVQAARDKLYVSTTSLWTAYDTKKKYTTSEIENLADIIYEVYTDIESLSSVIYKCWNEGNYKYDDNLVNLLDYAYENITVLKDNIDTYAMARTQLIETVDEIRSLLVSAESYNISEVEDEYVNDIDARLDTIIDQLGYIAGGNRRTAAMAECTDALGDADSWLKYIEQEMEIYERIVKISAIPNEFLDAMNISDAYLNAMADYMRTVDREFIPDTARATYSDIYEVDEVNLLSGGFLNKAGDRVFAPELGSYRISAVEDSVGGATALLPLNYRKTTFRDPCWQSNPYDSITSGSGIGVSIEAKSSKSIKIINDTVVERFVERSKNIVYMIKRDMGIINPYNNFAVSDTLDSIGGLWTDWNEILDIYSEYMSERARTSCTNIVASMNAAIEPLRKLISARENNDLKTFLSEFDKFIVDCYSAFESNRMISPTYIYFDNRMRAVYLEAVDFYGNGTTWNDETTLKKHVDDIVYELKLFHRKMLVTFPDSDTKNDLQTEYDALFTRSQAILDALIAIDGLQAEINDSVVSIEECIDLMPASEELQRDVWHNLRNVGVGEEGIGYAVGDIVKITPELPRDIIGNLIYDHENEIMSDVILLRVTQVNDVGGVVKIEPMMDYAIPYQIWGSRNTESLVGSGKDLVVTVYSYEIGLADSTLFLDASSDIAETPRFDHNDLFTFKFENIHDLDITYEVFYAGKQIRDFVIRHESGKDPLHPKNYDVIYLRANDVMDLRNSSIYMEGEHYFVYKLENVEIIDPGAGYAAGQEIVIDTDQIALKLKVASLMPNPLKQIETIEMLPNQSRFNGKDPTSESAKAVPDSASNIDDEFNTGYYDRLTNEGIAKGASVMLDPEKYPFVSMRFDDLVDGDRNKTYMYPTVDMPEGDGVAVNGDPDGHWYLGSRTDDPDHPWNGIMNAISPIDPFVPDDRRTPPGKPMNGEYQSISRLRIHNSEISPVMDSIPEETIKGIVAGSTDPKEPGTYTIHGSEFEGIPVEKISAIHNDTDLPVGTPTVIIDGEMIKAIDTSRIRDLIYGNIQGAPNPGAFFDSCLVNYDPNKKTDKTLNNAAMIDGDLIVPNYASMPQHIKEWSDVAVNKIVIVEKDETNGGHRMLYRVRTFLVSGYLVYDVPEIADFVWNFFDVDWMKADFYPDLPTLKAQYPDAHWRTTPMYRLVQHEIADGLVDRVVTPVAHEGTYIHDLTVDDLSVFNFTTNNWEDLHDESRWRLEVRNDTENNDYGFRLTFLQEGYYSYDMRLYLNKIPETQLKNAELKRDAIFRVTASIQREVNIKARNYSINTGRNLRIRKLFPYEQKESFIINAEPPRGAPKKVGVENYSMDFKLANYLHFKNEIHLEDVKIYNKTAGRFENILDPTMYEVRFKDDRAVERGSETQTKIVQSVIAYAGESFSDGEVWGWNAEYGIHVFGRVTSNFLEDGSILTFTPIHCPNPPKEDITLEFEVYQYASQRPFQAATVLIEFQTQKVEVWGDGYIHNVVNPLAPVPREFKVICLYDLDGPGEYDIIISKSSKTWTFIEPESIVFPTFNLPDINIQADRLYVMTDNGRMPLVNPSTYKPSFYVKNLEDSTEVTFLNLYKKYEHFEIHSVPYPMKSVYVQRKVPSSGYIDLEGKINKPLNKKYFEFWMNGRLLFDEVTIISPTKIFLHGLKSLRNFEIIEVNRDPNEYFSDNFLGVETPEYNRPFPVWNFDTYLDDALGGTLDGDNYRIEEQEYLLSPVWRQVERDHPEYKNFPPNQDLEADILVRVDDYVSMADIAMPAYQFTVLDAPTIEGIPISGKTMTFEHFGFVPISNDMLMDMLNEEWKDEIAEAKIPVHSIVTDDEWYGLATRLYDEFGIQVHTLYEAAYKIIDSNILRINTTNRSSRIVRNQVIYDLD